VTHACARFSDNSYDENEEGRTWSLEDDGSRAASTMQARVFLNPAKALFISRVFEGMEGDYFKFRNFPDRLFISPGFEEIIPGYPHKSPPL
jgi:hypothetical protein